MPLDHRLAAILFCDIVGYTSTTQVDESEAARQIEEHRKSLEDLVPKYNGSILQYYGDGSLTIFPSVIDAVDCALALQEKLGGPSKVPMRAGIHLGEIYFKDDQFIGDGINIASRIQSEAEAGQVLVSKTVGELIKNKPHLELSKVGERVLKNVQGTIALYSVNKVGTAVGKRQRSDIPSKNKRHGRIWLWTAAVITAVIASVFGIRQLTPSFSGNSGPAALAVLPFRSLSDDIEDKYLCLGISDDIRSTLARVEGLDVRSRSSSETILEMNLPARDIGQKLDIDYLLEGSFRRNNGRLHVNLSLVDVRSDLTVAPIEFSAISTEELLAVIDEVTSQVVRAIKPGASKEAVTPGFQTDNPTAYKHYLLGRSYLWRTLSMEDLETSEAYFRKAILEDPSFGRAYAGLAEVFLTPAAWGYADMHEGISRARPMANKALKLSPNEAETQYILGTIAEFELNFNTAEQYISKAIQMDPSNALSYLRMARIKVVQGEWENAMEYAHEATRLDPLSPLIASLEPVVLLRSGNAQAAVEACRLALEQYPGDNNLKFHLGEALTMEKRYQEATDVLLSRTISTADVNFLLGYIYAVTGQQEKANDVLTYLLEKESKVYVPPAMIGLIYLGMDEPDRAHNWMSRETNYFMLMFGMMRPLWDDDSFADIYSFLDS